jgi:hypothetical protein
MARGIISPRIMVEAFVPQARATCHGTRLSRSRGGSSCEAETCCASPRLVVRGGDLSEGVPLVGNWSDMLPSSREHDVLPMMVLTGFLSLPRLECWPPRCQWCWITLC